MHKPLHKFKSFLGVVANLLAEVAVVVGAEVLDDAVDEGGSEDALVLVYLAVFLQHVGAGGAAVGQHREAFQHILVLEDIDAHIAVFGVLDSVLHLESVTGGDGHAGEQQIDVGGAVGGTQFDGLLICEIDIGVFLKRVAMRHHIAAALAPAEGHTHHGRAVAVAPADVGGSLLMGHQTEIRCRVGVAEGGERTSEVEYASYGLVSHFGEAVVADVHVLAVLDDAGVDVHAAARLADGDFRGEGDGDAVFVTQLAHNPLGDDELVGSVLEGGGQKLNLVLLVHGVADGEVAHLGVTVFDKAATFGYELHSLDAELLELAERLRSVIAALVGREIFVILGSDDIVFEFAHNLELHAAGGFAKGLAGFGEGVFRSHFEGLAVLGVEVAEEVERGDIGEGVDEGGAETRDDVEVAAARLEEGEEAGSIDTLAGGKNLVGVVEAVDDEVEGLEATVVRHVAELYHLDVELVDDAEHVGLGELTHRFLQELHQTVWVVFEIIFVHNVLCIVISDK